MARPTRYSSELYDQYTRAGYWTETTLADLWDINASRFPGREAIIDSRLRLTWGEAKTWIDRMALGLLALGMKKDDLVVLQLPNSVELTLLRVACEKAGLLCLPVLRTFRHAEMEHILRFTGAAAVVILREFRGFDHLAMVREIQPRLPSLKHIIFAGADVPESPSPGLSHRGRGTSESGVSVRNIVQTPLERDHPYGFPQRQKTPWNEYSLVLHTSGTTGAPRLAEFPVCCNVYLGRVTAEILSLTPEDIVFGLSPAGLGPTMPAHLAAPVSASKIIMQEHFSPEDALRVIEKERVTVIGAVPAQLAMLSSVLAAKKYDTGSLRLVRVTGSPLAYHVGKEAEERLGAKLIQSYGSVDFSGISMGRPDDPQDARLLTVGYPNPGNEMRLVDDSGRDVPEGEVGEIWGRGPTAISGYFKDPQSTQAVWGDGWCRMGDLGKFDAAGRLMIVGRKKDVIIRGGQNIYPAEIEALLVTHPGVAAAAVVGMPDPVMGERACAFVAPKQGYRPGFAELTAFLQAKGIAPFKLPERMEILDSLPMVADGQKIDKKLLARRAAQ
ncbi:MAG: AMP-binding protein [Chloroflexi bacterium]|nr:AMP-binding protein [Chloroflexota bacterium]